MVISRLREFGSCIRDLTVISTAAYFLCSLALELGMFSSLEHLTKINTNNRLFLTASSLILTLFITLAIALVNFLARPVNAVEFDLSV